jgi:hypothetical protein
LRLSVAADEWPGVNEKRAAKQSRQQPDLKLRAESS